MATGDHAEAVRVYEQAVTESRDDVRALHRLAIIYIRLQRQTEAASLLMRAAELEPSNAQVLEDLAVLLDSFGRHAESVELAEHAHALDSTCARAVSLIAKNLGRRGRSADAVSLLEQVLAGEAIESRIKADLTWQLARLHAESGDHRQCIESIQKAQRLLVAALPNAPGRANEFVDLVDRCADALTPGAHAHGAKASPGTHVPKHLFLLGFPRSGTTLAESLLVSQPGVTATEEDQYLHHMLTGIPERLGAQRTYPECLELLSAEDLSALRDEYWRAQRYYFEIDSATVLHVDKSPLNLIHLGAIRRLFPDAAVVVAIRDPRDVVLSCQMQSFHDGQAVLHHSLQSSARVYAATMRLWRRCRACLDLAWCELRYESLIEDPESRVREILSMLDLGMDLQAFRRRDSRPARAIRTPSADAARAETHPRAVGRWRYYEDYLKPVMTELDPFVSAFGYE